MTPVNCISPPRLFGDVIFVLEFLHSFKSQLGFELPDDLSLGACTLFAFFLVLNCKAKLFTHVCVYGDASVSISIALSHSTI